VLLLQGNDTQVHQCACLKISIVTPAGACQAGLKLFLCVIEVFPIEVDTPSRAIYLSMKGPPRALTFGLQKGLFRLVRMTKPGLCDGEKDVSSRLGFEVGLSGKRLLKNLQGFAALTLIDEYLAQLKTKGSRPIRAAAFKALISFLRLLSGVGQVAGDKLFFDFAEDRVGFCQRLSFTADPNQRQDCDENYGMPAPLEKAEATLTLPSARHPISIRIMVSR